MIEKPLSARRTGAFFIRHPAGIKTASQTGRKETKAMYDQANRDIHCLRLSLTESCNLRCCYCRPQEPLSLIHI